MKSLKLTFLSFVILLSLSSTAFSATEQKIVFPLSKGENAISLEFRGAVYDNNTAIKISSHTTDKIALFISQVIAANASADKNRILALWSDKDKKLIDSAISNPQALKRNASLFRNIKSSSLMGYIEYGDYLICYVYHDISNGQGETYLKEYPLKATSTGYALTNDLSDDFFFNNISYKLAQHIWKRPH